METCTKKELKAKGYNESQAKQIIDDAKKELVKKGCVFYSTPSVKRVPLWIVEEMLGFDFETGNKLIVNG